MEKKLNKEEELASLKLIVKAIDTAKDKLKEALEIRNSGKKIKTALESIPE